MNKLQRNERGQVTYMARSNCAAEHESHFTNQPHNLTTRGDMSITLEDLPTFDPTQSNVANNRRLFTKNETT